MSSPEKEQSRKLRSDDSNKVIQNKNLFNFDDINVYLYQNKPMQMGKLEFDSQLYSYFKGDEETPTLKVIRVKKVPRKLPKRRTKVDPLPDSKYTIFHRKMKKEETQMLNEEKIKNLVEVDNLNTNLQLLRQYDWIRHLPSITKVNNIMDYEEMERKRDLTINEIEKLLEKQALWKRKRDKFNIDIKLFHNGERVAAVDEYALSNCERNSSKLKIGKKSLHEEAQLQPTSSPFVIDANVKLDSVDSTTDVNFAGSSNELFGVDLHDIEPPKNGFQLPLGWRRLTGNKK